MDFYTKTGAVLSKRSINTQLETWPIYMYIACVCCCLGSSTTYHCFYPCNKKAAKILHRLDIASIAILIFGSAASVVYYAFYCNLIEWHIWLGV